MKFTTSDGFNVNGEIAEYFTSEDGATMVRVRVAGSVVCVVAPAADLMVEV
ncbi:hypothetical protein PV729_04410 [Streptomyces europaeiscabiei]|uniref:Uncharacterized protein n=1 Tax=Streptomyces europaeiscabiei TaxID=146819 RepID=A0ABU4N9R7_9ACTN|nr:hypothetical protein [Streptomyces europaeiscabiei]MDX3551021.1 hypothetical protein [Streptomyces europaeiscabiei]MDX3698419.1 hypothetical protein [Streptomyces europaeiscabiei]